MSFAYVLFAATAFGAGDFLGGLAARVAHWARAALIAGRSRRSVEGKIAMEAAVGPIDLAAARTPKPFLIRPVSGATLP